MSGASAGKNHFFFFFLILPAVRTSENRKQELVEKKAGWLTHLMGPIYRIKQNPKQTSLKRCIVPHWAVPLGESQELLYLRMPSTLLLCLWDGTFQKHRKLL